MHHTQITTSGNVYKTLTEGEYVEYVSTVDEKNNKTLATDVTGIKKGPLLCERPKRTNRNKGPADEHQSSEQGEQGGGAGM